jgi:hypothetical protein
MYSDYQLAVCFHKIKSCTDRCAPVRRKATSRGPAASFQLHTHGRMRARASEACTVEKKGTCMRGRASSIDRYSAWPPPAACAGEQAGKECTCPASPPRAPRHIHPPQDLSIDDRSICRSHLRSRGWIYPCMAVTTLAMYIFSTTCCRTLVSTVPDYVEAEEVDRRGR